MDSTVGFINERFERFEARASNRAAELGQSIFEDVAVAHELKARLGIGKLAANIGRVENVECTLRRDVKLFGEHHHDCRLLAPKDVITHGGRLSF